MYLNDTAKALLVSFDIDPETFREKSPAGIALGALVADWAGYKDAATEALRGVERRIAQAVDGVMQHDFSEMNESRAYNDAIKSMRSLGGRPLAAARTAYKAETLEMEARATASAGGAAEAPVPA
jgi:hypothetical protein